MTRLAPGFWLSIVLFVACAAPADDPTGPGRVLSAKGGGGGGVTVSSADPSYGNQGEAGKAVRIIGSGFQPGDQASWQRNGVADPGIQVLSTQYVSSTELVATINIAADAELAFYDIAIYAPGRKGGIGTELFEVTQAIMLEGTAHVRDVNLAGEMTGRAEGPFYWSPLTGLETVGPAQAGRDISDDGLTISGGLGSTPTTNTAVVWNRGVGGWQETILPIDPAATNSGALALGSDPTTGVATYVGGWEIFKMKGNSWRGEARLWRRDGVEWHRVVLPGIAGTNSVVEAVTGTGLAVGRVDKSAAVWTPNGTGGWDLTLLGPGYLLDVNTAGSLAVGAVAGSGGDQARYWTRTGGTWNGPFSLPWSCTRAVAVDDIGRIVANICPKGSNGHTTAAVFVPPYSAAAMIFLGGTGNRTTGGTVEAISPDGKWIVGQATGGTGLAVAGVYWKIF